eukprot:TRINITY_DN951_c0_g2_i2.p1 TRINITY_DN951_c0_g2~~TRINITY_DN951_c0_g2_i2.p1  ORF type:complete len:2415 (-),score=843.80 TRINITY_DN951_c0_g2_i2:361-7515(-)
MSVGEVIKEIRLKTDGGKDHGVFVPADAETGKKAYWLAKNRTIRFYGLTNNANVTFKKMHRPLRIRLVDDTRKMVVIDDSDTVSGICSVIGQKIGLKSWEEFSLRRPAYTDDRGHEHPSAWLNDAETLHQQSVKETDELEYDKRYFYNDDFVDKDDPFSLHLLYVGANKDIVTGKYQITRTDARDFAAIQMQVVYGDHDPAKHKPGWVDMSEFYPPQYRKDKKIERDTYNEHKKLIGTRDMNAKFRYVQLVRSNKAYGVTYFECKQKRKGKKKPVTILIGVTRAKIMKVIPETMLVERSWEWSQMRRWSSVRKTFTLDFGDYEDDYINVTCEEADSLSSLIAGYIELILRTKVDPSRVIDDSDDEIAEAEQMEANFGLANQGMVASYNNPYGQGAGMGGMGQGFQRGFPGMWPQANSVQVEDMNSAIRATEFLSNELGTIKGNWGPPQGMSEGEWLKQYEKHRANITAGINDMLGQARLGLDSLNRNNLDAKSKEMVMEMMSMATAARNISAYNHDQAPLLDGAKAVADSLAGLMSLLGDALDNPDDYRDTLEDALLAAEKLFQGAEALMNIAITDYKQDKGAELLVADIIANIDVTLNDLLLKARKGANTLSPEDKKELDAAIVRLKAIKGLALAQMKQLAPVLQNDEAQKHLKVAAATLGQATDGLSGRATALGVSNAPDINDSVMRINRALELLLNADKLIETAGLAGDVDLYGPVQQLIVDLAAVRGTLDDPRAVISNVKAAANDQNAIIEATQALADGADPDTQDRLTRSAKALTTNIETLMSHTRFLVKEPEKAEHKTAVVETVNDLEKLALKLIGDSGTATAVNNLRYAAKVAVASLLKLTTAAAIYSDDVDDAAIKKQLAEDVKAANDHVVELVAKLQAATGDPRNFNVQSILLDTALFQLPNYAELVATAKEASQKIADSNKKQDLDLTSTETSNNLRLLAQAVANVSSLSGDAALESAFSEFDIIRADLDAAAIWANAGKLKPVSGTTKASAQALLVLGAKDLRDQIAHLNSEARKGYVTGLTNPIEQAAQAFQQIASATRPLAVATSADRRVQVELIGKVQEALEATVANISVARALAVDKKSKPKKAATDKAEQKFNDNVDKLENISQGLVTRDIDAALLTLDAKLQLLGKKSALNPDMSYGDLQSDLLSASKAMDIAAEQLVVTARDNPDALSYSARVLGATAGSVLEKEAALIAATGDPQASAQLTNVGKQLAANTVMLLKNAQVVAEKNTPEGVAKLGTSEGQVHTSLAQLQGMLASGSEVDVAVSDILMNISLARDGKMTVVPGTASDILSEIIAETQELQRVNAAVVKAAEKDTESVLAFSDDLRHVSVSLLGTAQAASISNGTGKYASLDGARIVIGAELIAESPGDDEKVHTIARQITQAAGNLIGEAKARARTEADASKRAAIVKKAQALIMAASNLARAASNTNENRNPRDTSAAATELANKAIELENSIRSGKKTSDTVDPSLAKRLVDTSQNLSLASSSLYKDAATNAGDSQKQAYIAEKGRALDQQISDFKQLVGALNPAVSAANNTVQGLKKASIQLDAARGAAQAGTLTADLQGKNLSEHQDAVSQLLSAINKDIAQVSASVNAGAPAVAAASNALGADVASLVTAITALAVATPDEGSKVQNLALAKALTDSLVDLLKGVQAANLNDPSAGSVLANSAKAGQQAIKLLTDQLMAGSAPLAELDDVRNKMLAALKQLSGDTSASSNYTNNRATLLDTIRDFAAKATQVLSVDKTSGNKTRAAIVNLADVVPLLVAASNACAATTAEESTKGDILASTQAMGEGSARMVGHAKSIAEGKSEQPELLIAYNDTISAVSQLLATTKKGATGELMIEKALKENSKALVVVATASMFAEAEQLESDEDTKAASMSSLLEALLADTKALSANTAEVNEATKGSDDVLGQASLSLASTANSLASDAKKAISRLTNVDDQKAALRAVKQILISNQDLLQAGRAVQRNPQDSSSKAALAKAHNDVAVGIQNLHRTLDNSAAQLTAHEKLIDDQKKDILALLQSQPKRSATPEDVVKAAREIIQASADLYFAESDNEAVTAALNSASSTSELVAAINGVKDLSDQPAVKQALDDASTGVVNSVAQMLELGKKNRDDEETKQAMENQSEKVTQSVNDLIYALRRLPNAENITLEEKGTDLDSLAEQELLKCAQIIADAAATLMQARPKQRVVKKVPGTIDQQDINDAILDAASAIASATGLLVKAAAVAQGERVAKIKETPGQKKYMSDPTWANGLISAAQNVAGAVSQLVKAANESVEGKAQEEALVASAKAVATATAHLVAASRSKADPVRSLLFHSCFYIEIFSDSPVLAISDELEGCRQGCLSGHCPACVCCSHRCPIPRRGRGG